MKCAAIALCVASFAAVAGGATVEVLTEGWTGSGVRKKWSFRALDATLPCGAARFTGGSRISSPIWPEAVVLCAAVTLACSTNTPTRWLRIRFLYEDDKPIRLEKFDAPAEADRLETQMVYADPDRVARGIELTVSEGDVGEWSVSKISLVCNGSLAKAHTNPPQGLAVLIR